MRYSFSSSTMCTRGVHSLTVITPPARIGVRPNKGFSPVLDIFQLPEGIPFRQRIHDLLLGRRISSSAPVSSAVFRPQRQSRSSNHSSLDLLSLTPPIEFALPDIAEALRFLGNKGALGIHEFRMRATLVITVKAAPKRTITSLRSLARSRFSPKSPIYPLSAESKHPHSSEGRSNPPGRRRFNAKST